MTLKQINKHKLSITQALKLDLNTIAKPTKVINSWAIQLILLKRLSNVAIIAPIII